MSELSAFDKADETGAQLGDIMTGQVRRTRSGPWYSLHNQRRIIKDQRVARTRFHTASCS
jgi:hypothetical protein